MPISAVLKHWNIYQLYCRCFWSIYLTHAKICFEGTKTITILIWGQEISQKIFHIWSIYRGFNNYIELDTSYSNINWLSRKIISICFINFIICKRIQFLEIWIDTSPFNITDRVAVIMPWEARVPLNFCTANTVTCSYRFLSLSKFM